MLSLTQSSSRRNAACNCEEWTAGITPHIRVDFFYSARSCTRAAPSYANEPGVQCLSIVCSFHDKTTEDQLTDPSSDPVELVSPVELVRPFQLWYSSDESRPPDKQGRTTPPHCSTFGVAPSQPIVTSRRTPWPLTASLPPPTLNVQTPSSRGPLFELRADPLLPGGAGGEQAERYGPGDEPTE